MSRTSAEIDAERAGLYFDAQVPVRVKICGITNRSDAEVAVEAGADALGFIFYEASPRFISPTEAARISAMLPPFVSRVGVFVNSPVDEIKRSIEQSGIDRIQLHGSEDAAFCQQFTVPVIKAFRVQDSASLKTLKEYYTAAFLLDSYVAGQLGGTGEKFNWELAVQAKQYGRPIILAGGLKAQNVGDAVAKVRPYGVDVSSGVEKSPGKKDHAAIREFVANAKAAQHV